MGLFGVVLALSSLTLFYRTGQNPEPWKPSPVLIRQGPYRLTRNPMYVGMVLLQCGLGLFLGAELVADRATKEPAPEAKVQAVVADCMAQGVIIGATNRSVPGRNNTLCFSPALIATKDDIDQIVSAVDGALGRVFA